MIQKSGLDTSPIITDYGKALPVGSPLTIAWPDSAGDCVTDYYNYQAQSYRQTLTLFGGSGNIALFRNGSYVDYWNFKAYSESTRNVININTNRMRLTLSITRLDRAYAYLVETGQILFAGKNSIYYGHLNTSELN